MKVQDRIDAVAVGVDTGGTHTDLVLAGRGQVHTLKVPSTTDDLKTGIVDGLKKLANQAGIPISEIDRFVYASTFVTNLFIEGKQAQVGLITTEGFRDVLEIGRASRKPDVYDIHWRPAPPLVPRNLRVGVHERINHKGETVIPLNEASVHAALDQLVSGGVDSLAVCLLHSYANPAHERRIADIAAEKFPSLNISLSSDVIREFREYERMSTTCVNASIKAPIARHLQSLAQDLQENGLRAAPAIMQGNGGICSFEAAALAPVDVTHSGVMGGIVGAAALGLRVGAADVITLDMGGTSADVSLISNGRPALSHRTSVGPYPLLAPTLDMITIGAGGGSIAWIDGGTALRVGPQSAGSKPGPACYGGGGKQPTVTDANLVTGRLNGDYFLKGARHLDLDAARSAIKSIAEPLNLSIEQCALGIIAIAEAHMADAIRLISVERGLDPRDFHLVAFGGAGALHAARLAEELAMKNVVIPPAPGNQSAMGLLGADIRHDHARTFFVELAPSIASDLSTAIDELLSEGRRSLEADGVKPEEHRFEISVDLRYQGQNYELTLALPKGPLSALDASGFDQLKDRFESEHLKVYGYQLNGRSIQLVNVRVTATGGTAHASWATVAVATDDVPASPIGKRDVLIESGNRTSVNVFRHDLLLTEHELNGPAIVEFSGSTLFVPPNWHAKLHESGSILMSRG